MANTCDAVVRLEPSADQVTHATPHERTCYLVAMLLARFHVLSLKYEHDAFDPFRLLESPCRQSD